MLQENPRVLILSAVTRIGVDDQLSVGQALGQDERVDGRHDNVFVAVNNERWMSDALQGGVTTA